MELTLRQQDILERAVAEYIRLAQPISSQYLDHKYNFACSSATIRNELLALSEQGYLLQPHTSAGRVPTDKGYRFVVDRLLKEKEALQESGRARLRAQEPLELLQALSRELSLASSLFVAAAWRNLMWKEGWETLLWQPEFEERQTLLNFARFLEDFEENLEELPLNATVHISIGRENRFSKMQDFSIMVSELEAPTKDRITVALLGPKRMAYDKNLHLLQSLGQEFFKHGSRKGD